MLNYKIVEELKQIPIDKSKEKLNNPSEIVLEYLEYMIEHRKGIVMHPEDYAILQERLVGLQIESSAPVGYA